MTALLELRSVCSGYGTTPVLDGVDLTVEPGEIVCLLGANGAGKTTTLRTVSGEIKATDGTISWCGQPLRGRTDQRMRDGLGYITEERSVLMSLTTEQNLRLGRGSVADALTLMPELEPHLDRRAGLLSGGQQQILAVARALAARPKLLLADELSLGLAPLIVARLLDALRRASQDHGIGVLVVEQHVRKALALADRGYVMKRGRIVMSGTSSELLARLPEIESGYLS